MRRAGAALCGRALRALQSHHHHQLTKSPLPLLQHTNFAQVSRTGSSWIGLRHASTATTADSKPAEEVAEGLTLTDNCIRRIQEIKLEEGPEGEKKMLRLSVEGGGCSGFMYNFSLDDKLNKDDRVFERDGAKLVVDDISYSFIKGATVDFSEELIRASFAVTINPNAASACGCGASFNAK